MGPCVSSIIGVTKHLLIILIAVCEANDNAKRLYDDLLRSSGYNKLIRPVGNNSDKLVVKLGIRLSQLIDIDEKNQIMTTNVWLRQEWLDVNLRWNATEYFGIKEILVPSEDIWRPDIVLFNKMTWLFPAVATGEGVVRNVLGIHYSSDHYLRKSGAAIFGHGSADTPRNR